MAANSWRRNPWVWLVIAIPAATVIGCLITIYLAINNPDTIVSDAVSIHHVPQGSVASRPV